jgi:hypothetical protein
MPDTRSASDEKVLDIKRSKTSVALLNHVQRDRDASSFEAAVTNMHAVLGRRLFAHEWRHAWLFRDIQIVDAPH